MKYLCFIFMIVLTLGGLNGQTTVTGTLMHDGLLRDYRLHLPPGHSPSKKAPLVFNLHGYTSNAAQQELYSGMNAVADTAGFLVCYPNGISSAWNVGWAFGSTAKDVSFISSLIDELHTKYGIDKDRVYACGMSNGGFMSYKLACELNDRITAIASVTGSMVPSQLSTCKPGRPVPVMEVHGTADQVVAYNGTAPISAPIPDVLNFWRDNNGCDDDPVVVAVPNTNTADNTTSEKWTYTNCSADATIMHYKVFGGAHTWPGAIIITGATSRDFNASVEIWNFFRRYRLPVATATDENTTISGIYPNPFTDKVELTSSQGGRLLIHDLAGRSEGIFWLSPGKNNIDTQNLNSGFYIFTIMEGGRVIRHRLIKH